MIRIKIICDGEKLPFHVLQHASIILSDLNTKKSYVVNYYPFSDKKLFSAGSTLEEMESTCERSVITLYCQDSTKSLSGFKKLYDKQFAKKNYNVLFRNCSDAANLAINYFFPEAEALDKFHCAYDSLCCLLCLGTLGLKCFSPSCIGLPIRTFENAKKLEKYYGRPDDYSPLFQNDSLIESKPAQQTMS